MFYLNVWLTIQPEEVGRMEEISAKLKEAAALSREEPGCERFEVYASESTPGKWLLTERWADKAAWETHREAEAVQTIYLPQVLPYVEREAHFCSLLSEAEAI
ncbi:Antibiotic biosynthesis monooxygenase [Planctomycetales bacterium 10988]|nr:Antibiotic biosynthesis monooxygenase [Planctomycetales bacterium 10988]